MLRRSAADRGPLPTMATVFGLLSKGRQRGFEASFGPSGSSSEDCSLLTFPFGCCNSSQAQSQSPVDNI